MQVVLRHELEGKLTFRKSMCSVTRMQSVQVTIIDIRRKYGLTITGTSCRENGQRVAPRDTLSFCI